MTALGEIKSVEQPMVSEPWLKQQLLYGFRKVWDALGCRFTGLGYGVIRDGCCVAQRRLGQN